jgi:hypothetical protein
MTAKITSINGVTRLHSFEFDITRFQRVGGQMQATGKHSEFGLGKDQWPDNFVVPIPGLFRLADTLPNGARVYRCDDNVYTVQS